MGAGLTGKDPRPLLRKPRSYLGGAAYIDAAVWEFQLFF